MPFSLCESPQNDASGLLPSSFSLTSSSLFLSPSRSFQTLLSILYFADTPTFVLSLSALSSSSIQLTCSLSLGFFSSLLSFPSAGPKQPTLSSLESPPSPSSTPSPPLEKPTESSFVVRIASQPLDLPPPLVELEDASIRSKWRRTPSPVPEMASTRTGRDRAVRD